MKKKLPDKMYQLLRLALSDLDKCNKDKSYRLCMGNWHIPDVLDDVCHVCMAGAVMAKTLNADKNKVLRLEDFKGLTRTKLRAIDYIRQLYFDEAYKILTNFYSLPVEKRFCFHKQNSLKHHKKTITALIDMEKSYKKLRKYKPLSRYPIDNIKDWKKIADKFEQLNV